MAKLFFKYGAMNAGKSTLLMQAAHNYEERGMRVLLIKPSVDTMDIPVICYGLRTDFLLNGFEGSTRLLELAHNIEEIKTICACGKKALINARKVNGEFVFQGKQVAIDGEEVEYESLCPKCYLKYKQNASN